jgi:hypothetical protein
VYKTKEKVAAVRFSNSIIERNESERGKSEKKKKSSNIKEFKKKTGFHTCR